MKTVSGKLLDSFQVLADCAAWKHVSRGLCQAELPSGRVGERKVVENKFLYKIWLWDDEVAQRMKALVTKPEALSSSPGTRMVEGENNL